MEYLIDSQEDISSTVISSVPKMDLLKISDGDRHYQQEEESSSPPLHDAPIVSSYNNRIRPLLDTVDRLRNLKVMQEGIQLPTIVVVGDQSSGKSSVLESLAGISLPRGQGICTRVPLIMRLQHHQSPNPELFLEFNGKTVSIAAEANISDYIISATEELAGTGKGISNNPLTLIVKKKGVPDLTMVDLPGITRVAVRDQPKDIYEQISAIIMEYITPVESIILNVISAGVDFSTSESIKMSQSVDKSGQRTLAVVTKADKSQDDLLEKVTTDDVNIGLGYVCVRNRIGDESYEEAREEEAKLFQTHTRLSKIDKSIVGIPVLAEKLMKIQATIIAKCLPEIVRNISHKLNANVAELKKMPKHLTSVAEAMTALLHILGSAKESLSKILLQGEFDEYPDSRDMHCTARLAEMLNKFSEDLQSDESTDNNKEFLVDEIDVLEETKAIRLPNFWAKCAFNTLLQKKVQAISAIPFDFAGKTWSYVETVVVSVLLQHCENYPQLLSTARRAAQNLISKKKERSIDWIKDLVEMEKLTDYTCNPEYTASWNKLMSERNQFMERVDSECYMATTSRSGEFSIKHLHRIKGFVEDAFDLKMRMTAYWDIVLRRIVDNMALHLMLSIQNLVKKEMLSEMIEELIAPPSNGLERMLEEPPSVTEKRKMLQKSIKLLKESRDVVANIVDRVVADVD